MEKVEQGCYSAQTLSTLQMYEERLGGEFSTPHFQALKAKACAVGSGASGVMRVWNAAWVQCQEVRQRLEEMEKKKGVDKNQIQQTTAANHQGEDGGVEKKDKKSEVGECSLTQQLNTQEEVVNVLGSEGESATAACFSHHLKSDLKGSEKGEPQAQKLPEVPVKTEKMTPVFPQSTDGHQESKRRPREHHSETDLRSADSVEWGNDFPSHQPLGRSLSEGSHVSSHLTSISGFSPLNVRHKHCQSKTQPLEQNLQPVQNLPSSHDKSLRSGNLSCESKRDSNEEEGEGCTTFTQNPKVVRTPETLLTPAEDNGSNVL